MGRLPLPLPRLYWGTVSSVDFGSCQTKLGNMQVDGNLFGNPYRNVWAAVILTALDDLKIPFQLRPKWSSGIERQMNRRQAIWFFNYPSQSSLSWICEKLNLDLQATVKKAHEICPEINLSIEKGECYHKGATEKAAHG